METSTLYLKDLSYSENITTALVTLIFLKHKVTVDKLFKILNKSITYTSRFKIHQPALLTLTDIKISFY